MTSTGNNLAQELYDSVEKICENALDLSSGEIRRAISTAYYAVFRLIIDDGLLVLFPDEKHREIRNMWSRRFTHTTVREICNKFVVLEKLTEFKIYGKKEELAAFKRSIENSNNLSKCDSLLCEEKINKKEIRQVKNDIALLALYFGYLYSKREEADYNPQSAVSTTEELNQVFLFMDEFFQTWHKLKTDEPEAMNTLIALFLLGIKDKQG